MFAQLGDIEFELITYFNGLNETQTFNFAEHERINQKPMLQFMGLNLQEQEIKLNFHSSFCTPEDEIKRLKGVANKGTPLKFIKGNGEYVGVFVISEIVSAVEQASKEGDLISIQVDLKLREFTGKIPEAKAPYLVWIVTNEKENVMNVLKTINKHSIDFGIFVFKASLIDNIITYKCLLKPDIKAKSTSGGKAKQIQLEYWEKYSEVCDELGEGNFQINPKPKHWQYISMGKAGVAIWLTVNTQIGFIGVDFLINDDKELFEKLQNSQKEIEKDLGILDWENKPNVKTSRIRKTVPFDINNKENLNTSIKTHIEMAKIFKTTFSKYL